MKQLTIQLSEYARHELGEILKAEAPTMDANAYLDTQMPDVIGRLVNSPLWEKSEWMRRQERHEETAFIVRPEGTPEKTEWFRLYKPAVTLIPRGDFWHVCLPTEQAVHPMYHVTRLLEEVAV